MKQLMLGNEAVARGLYEAGCSFVSSYPGTPSTEITECAARYPEIYAEWAPNEKVAMEVASGASFGGDGLRCHVFTWQDGSVLEDLLPWSDGDEEGIALAKEILTELNVPEEDWPSFELDVPEDWPDTSACLSWHGNIREEDPRDQLVILYVPERACLWVLESFV